MKYRTKKHLFETDPEYLMKYLDVLKEEKYWRNNGQYFMAKECERRAICLQKENIGSYESFRKTEELYCPTKKMNIDTYNRNISPNEFLNDSNKYSRGKYSNNKYSNNKYSNRNQYNSEGVKGRSDTGNWR